MSIRPKLCANAKNLASSTFVIHNLPLKTTASSCFSTKLNYSIKTSQIFITERIIEFLNRKIITNKVYMVYICRDDNNYNLMLQYSEVNDTDLLENK